ncbi:hypothetical protein POX_b02095 [Penicillium oxalicum]|nr:hypothetical protein POX_b02095 [Penicillium oxalicum]KAI2792061.1 hypothetical protein POX_b02095 [Penicillium oxalicum]
MRPIPYPSALLDKRLLVAIPMRPTDTIIHTAPMALHRSLRQQRQKKSAGPAKNGGIGRRTESGGRGGGSRDRRKKELPKLLNLCETAEPADLAPTMRNSSGHESACCAGGRLGKESTAWRDGE